jgi:hypothetical protein
MSQASGDGVWRPPPPDLAEFFSIEASFVLFVFAGRFKMLPELRSFPVDFTLLFVNDKKRSALSVLRGSRLDRNRLAAATSLKRIISTTGKLNGAGLSRPETIAQAIRQNVTT